MEEFLSSRLDLVKGNTEDTPGFHVVLGNEACDMDSMVSALVYAYFLFKTQSQGLAPVPVLNIPRSEFALRTDSVLLLRQSGLTPDLLLFRDQLDLRALNRTGRLTLTLVDHNVLPGADSELEGAVLEVIDHHLLERVPCASCPVTVETVGSCVTLVTERIIQKAPEVLDQQLALLLYGTMVLDCVNMSPEAGKVTPKDSRYAALLEVRFPCLPLRGDLFQSLQDAKFDVSGLTTEQMLLKDMKAVSGGGLDLPISVVYTTLEEFLQRPGLERELEVFCQRQSYNVLLVMTISFSEQQEPFRQLAVYSATDLYSRALERAQNPSLSLSPISSPHPYITAYLQGNSLASRKKLLPIVKDFLRERELGEGHSGMEEDSKVPATPKNSLVEGCPLDNDLSGLNHPAVEERVSSMAGQGL